MQREYQDLTSLRELTERLPENNKTIESRMNYQQRKNIENRPRQPDLITRPAEEEPTLT